MASLPFTKVGDSTLQVYADVIIPPSSPGEPYKELNIQVLSSNVGYVFSLPWNIRVLAAGGNSDSSNPPAGFLYVPDIDGEECMSKQSDVVPANVTRKANLPDVSGLQLIGIAPFLPNNTDCSAKYLAAAQADEVRGFLFFLPGRSDAAPPVPESPTWLLAAEDGGDKSNKWQTTNPYPVFAIPSDSGAKLLDTSASYSQNISDVPFGDALGQMFGDADYVRLYAEIDTNGSTALPNLWVLLLIVLAIVLGLMGTLSLLMHWLQARRRKDLRRRVESGAVDLEALGIKRLTVPKEVLEKMPLYTYGTGKAAQLNTVKETAETTTTTPNPTPTTETEKPKSSPPPEQPALNSSWPAPSIQRPPPVTRANHTPTALLQPTCPICLEEFHTPTPPNATTDPSAPAAAGTPGTIVRELPCQHIFHPECVDTFLSSTSSLCPMCKTAALPKGYCPQKITNAMVRRERLVRRRGLEAVVLDERTRMASRTIGGAAAAARMRAEASAGTISARNRSRMVSWGAGLANLPPHYERTRMHSSTSAAARRRLSAGTGTEMSTISPPPRPPTAPGAATATDGEAGDVRVNGTVQPASNDQTREWARLRALALLGRRYAPDDPDAEEARAMPWYRKVGLKLFPRVGR